MLGLIAGGMFVGNFIRSWKTDENYQSAKAKNRKATRIVQDAVEEFEAAVKTAETEQTKMLDVKEKAYKALLEFVEIFKTIDDVRFRESTIIGTAQIGKLSPEVLSMLKELKYEPMIVDNTSVGDGLGMLSMLLPIGMGSFGSFSSLQQSKAAVEEATANIYEAECIAREMESMTLCVNALGDRTKLVGDVLSGIYELWYKNAIKEFKYLVDSKNTIKYYFVNSKESVYTDEEYGFVASLAALSKTVKTLIDAKIFDEEESETQELSPNPKIVRQVEEIKREQKKDESFGLKQTYCAGLLEGKIKSNELVRPSDRFVDDFAATRARLEQGGYEALCKFDDYLKKTVTNDSQETRKRYFEVCDGLFADELYRKLAKRVKESSGKYGYGTLCSLKATLEQSDDVSIELDNLIEYVEGEIQSILGKKGTPKLGKGGFKGLKKLVHICLFEIEGRRKEKMILLGEALSQSAIDRGYKNKAFGKLPTRMFYEERKRKAKPLDCVVATLLAATMVFGLFWLDLFRWENIALVGCLYLLFVITNRKESGVLKILQMLACFGAVGLCGYIFYINASDWLAMQYFMPVNGIVLGVSVALLLVIHETKEYRNLYLSRVTWIISISCYVLFGIKLLEMLTEITYGLIIGTAIQTISILVSLNGLNRAENLKFDKEHDTDEKTLKGFTVMVVPVGVLAIILLSKLMEYAGIGSIILLILSAVFAFVAGFMAFDSKVNLKRGIGIVFIAGLGTIVGLLVFGLFGCVFNLNVILSLVIAVAIYLALTCFLSMVIATD